MAFVILSDMPEAVLLSSFISAAGSSQHPPIYIASLQAKSCCRGALATIALSRSSYHCDTKVGMLQRTTEMRTQDVAVSCGIGNKVCISFLLHRPELAEGRKPTRTTVLGGERAVKGVDHPTHCAARSDDGKVPAPRLRMGK